MPRPISYAVFCFKKKKQYRKSPVRHHHFFFHVPAVQFVLSARRCLGMHSSSIVATFNLLGVLVLGPCFFFFNDTATTEIYTLSLHDALPISDLIPASPMPTVLLSVASTSP